MEKQIRRLKKQEKSYRICGDAIRRETRAYRLFFESASVDASPLWFLGKSIELLSKADVAYFVKGWDEARGCKIEHQCAVEYGVDRIED